LDYTVQWTDRGSSVEISCTKVGHGMDGTNIGDLITVTDAPVDSPGR